MRLLSPFLLLGLGARTLQALPQPDQDQGPLNRYDDDLVQALQDPRAQATLTLLGISTVGLLYWFRSHGRPVDSMPEPVPHIFPRGGASQLSRAGI